MRAPAGVQDFRSTPTGATSHVCISPEAFSQREKSAEAEACLAHLKEAARSDELFFPLPKVPKPHRPSGQSSRLRSRQRRIRRLHRHANELVTLVNALFIGSFDALSKVTNSRPVVSSPMVWAAHARTHRLLLREAGCFERRRREFESGFEAPTGGPSGIAALLKGDVACVYGGGGGPRQVPIVAALLSEPSTLTKVSLADSLPPEYQQLFSEEDNVIDPRGKSWSLKQDLEDQFAFVGGSYREFVAYLNRPDVSDLWEFVPAERVRAFCGLSAVLKKDGITQRKILMPGASNYWMLDVRGLAQQGLLGGGSLTQMLVKGDSLSVSQFDEESAFTRVEGPQWLRVWQGVPPVAARDVWERIHPDIRSSLHPADWVSGLYTRLAMGSTISCLIIIAINVFSVGRSLVASAKLRIDLSHPQSCASSLAKWAKDLLLISPQGPSFERWLARVRWCRTLPHRVFVGASIVLQPQQPLIAENVRSALDQCVQAALDFEHAAVESCLDIQCCPGCFHDPCCSSENVAIVHGITQLIENGNLDFLHIRLPMVGTSSPLAAYHALVYAVFWCQKMIDVGGAFVLEWERHGLSLVPPGCVGSDDARLLWLSFLKRVPRFRLGGSRTTIAGGPNVSGISAADHFTCISQWCNIEFERGSGPGVAHKDSRIRRLTAFSMISPELCDSGFAVLNEEGPKGNYVILSPLQSAFYLHVDDGIFACAGGGDSDDRADFVMNKCADDLEDLGFVVPSRSRASEKKVVVGYEPETSPARWRLGVKRSILLRNALVTLSSWMVVNVDVVASVLGVWVWGALLRRDLLSIPDSIFSFTSKLRGTTSVWWPSARREARAMASAVTLMIGDVGAPLAPVLLATDASGESEEDLGGFGVVASELTESELENVLRRCHCVARTISELSGDIRGLRDPSKELKATKPSTLLPHWIFEEDRWIDIGGGRWRSSEHITLLEYRTVIKALDWCVLTPELHRTTIIGLEDNMATAGACGKGRSPSWALNRLCRMKAARTLVAAIRWLSPWIQTAVMPADRLSRRLQSPGECPGNSAPP